jgi:apoptosis-inducing factor 3
VYAIHTDKKKITFARGQPMNYDKILIATGGTARKPPIPGIDSKFVYFLRSAKDQEKIKERAKKVKTGIAIIGSGFIGSESAAALKMKYKDAFEVHMIGMEEYPLELALGKKVGSMIAKEHTDAGVKLYMKNGVKEIVKDENDKVSEVVLNDG